MRIIKSIIVAFSMYSRIPMPQFAWKDEDMKYMLCFFPWVGAVTGFCLFLWGVLSGKLLIGQTAYILIATAIPLLITGGFHVDGFMDTMDAFHSYQPKERKLEIMKDSHIGAFSVISLALLGMLWLAAISEINRAGAKPAYRSVQKAGLPYQTVHRRLYFAIPKSMLVKSVKIFAAGRTDCTIR